LSALTVGLTGGLASGKSTVGRWLAEAGFRVIDSDSLVAELYRPGDAGARAVEGLFGRGVLDREGAVDHQAVARRVFADPAARRRLERAVHPLVRERFRELASGGSGVVVLEVPLLVEAGMARDFDLVVSVEAPAEARIERAVARGLSEAEARARVAAQTSEARRREVADLVIENDGTLGGLRRQVDRLAARLREDAG
jgi:dephospho-CoA kinase